MSTAKRPESTSPAPHVRIVPERPTGVRPSGAPQQIAAPPSLTPPCASAPRPLSAPIVAPAPMAAPQAAPRPSSPMVRVSPSPLAGGHAPQPPPGSPTASGVAGFFSSLLPTAGPRPTAAPARPAAGPSASGMHPRPSEVFLDDDDTPILVIDDVPLPAGISLPQQPKTFFARSLLLRYDTAAVGVFLSAIVLGVTFMVGRATVANAGGGPRAEQEKIVADSQKHGQNTQPADDLISQTRAASSAPALSTYSPLADREEVPAPQPPPVPRQPAPTPPSAAPQAPGSPTGGAGRGGEIDPEPTETPAPPASTDGKWWITVLQKGTKDGVEDVKKLLESKGFQVTIEKSGERFYNVHVGSYTDRRGAPCKKDLAAVKAIQYKGRAFDEAYVEAMKRAP